MTVFLPILVCLCGGVGASCRYLLDVTIKTYWQRAFPLSTFTINLIAGIPDRSGCGAGTGRDT